MADSDSGEMREVEVSVELPARLAEEIEANPGRVRVSELVVERGRECPR
jgi:hypothetical protein